MVVSAGWREPFQTPKFAEYAYIIRGKKQFIVDGETIVLKAGQSIKIKKILGFNMLVLLIKNVNILLFALQRSQ